MTTRVWLLLFFLVSVLTFFVFRKEKIRQGEKKKKTQVEANGANRELGNDNIRTREEKKVTMLSNETSGERR